MAFGRKRNHDDILEQGNSEGVNNDVDGEEEEENTDYNESEPQTQTQSRTNDGKPLLEEVVFISTSNNKNAGGSKVWVCNHCKQQSTSSYSRIHIQFFGPPPGKKAEIWRCGALIKDREKYEALRKRVSNAEQAGVSKALKHYVISKNHSLFSTKKLIEQLFGIMERSSIDLKVMRGLCANRIPFNVLRNPQFQEIVAAINKAPAGYKAPSSDKARTVLHDECAIDVEKDLVPIKDTWYTQGVSIVSDGWPKAKHKPLINILVVNSRGATFMHAEDFSGEEKIGVEISKYLLKAIESIGPSNVLQVVM